MHINIYAFNPEKIKKDIFVKILNKEIESWTLQRLNDTIKDALIVHEGEQFDHKYKVKLIIDGKEPYLLKATFITPNEDKDPKKSLTWIVLGNFVSMLGTHFSNEILRLEVNPK